MKLHTSLRAPPQLIWLGLLVAAGLPAMAQTQAAPPDTSMAARAADPNAATSRLVYQSVFSAPGGLGTAPVDWKRANADVGQFKRGHIDWLKWEDAQSAKPAGAHVHTERP